MRIEAPKRRKHSIHKLLVCLCLAAVGLGTACQAEKASYLAPVEGDPGIFRYVEGDQSTSVIRFSAEMSRKGGRFVILVAATSKQETQALAHAKKLAAWFVKKIDEINEIPIVIYRNEKGTGYTYFISGDNYYHEEYAVGGVMTPQQTVASRDNAILSYRARKVIREEGSEDSEWFN